MTYSITPSVMFRNYLITAINVEVKYDTLQSIRLKFHYIDYNGLQGLNDAFKTLFKVGIAMRDGNGVSVLLTPLLPKITTAMLPEILPQEIYNEYIRIKQNA